MIPKNGHRDRSRGPMVTKIGSDTIEMITNRFHLVLVHFEHFRLCDILRYTWAWQVLHLLQLSQISQGDEHSLYLHAGPRLGPKYDQKSTMYHTCIK